MITTRRNVMWPVIIVTVGSIWLLMTAGAFPEAVGDILVRAWPALLVLFAFDLLVGRRRMRLAGFAVDMNLIGVPVTALLLVGVAWFAYAKQADVLREDNVQTFSQTVGDDVSRLRIDLSVERTSITILPSESGVKDLNAEYKGSNESNVQMTWSVEGETGVLTVNETHLNAIPKLEDYGRGTLAVYLPTKVTIQQVNLEGREGDVDFDMRPLQIEQIKLALDSGNVALTLPEREVLTGTVSTSDGGIELQVPPDVALTVSLAPGSGEPSYVYDTLKYDLLRNGTLKLKNTDAFQVGLTVSLKGGAPLTVVDLEE